MNGMRYEAPSSVDEASALLAGASGETRVLAGGTDLLVQLRSGMVAPELVVDVKKIKEMMTYSVSDGAYTIGAAVPSAQLHEDADLRLQLIVTGTHLSQEFGLTVKEIEKDK